MMLCVAAAILLPIASLSPATSLDTPTIDVPDQPMDTATATATVDGNGVVTDAGGSAAGCMALPGWFDKAPSWWFSAAAIVWKFIPYLGIGVATLIVCCCVCVCMKRCCLGRPPPRHHPRDYYYEEEHRRPRADPDRRWRAEQLEREALERRRPSWTHSFLMGLGRGALWSERRRSAQHGAASRVAGNAIGESRANGQALPPSRGRDMEGQGQEGCEMTA